MTDASAHEEDTREIVCPRCGHRLVGLPDTCPSCGASLRRAPSNADPSGERGADLEQALAAGKHERSQLLKHLVAKDDELGTYKEELETIRSERDRLRTQLAERDGERGGRRTAVTLAYALAAIAGAAIAAGVFHQTAYRSIRDDFSQQKGELDAKLQQTNAENQRLQTELAATRPTNPPPDVKPFDAPVPIQVTPAQVEAMRKELEALRKDAPEKRAALEDDAKRLTDRKQNVDDETRKLADAKRAFDEGRKAFEKERADWLAERNRPSNASSGVLVWSGSTTGPTAVMLSANAKPNHGAMTGTFPGKPAAIKVGVFNGSVKIFEEPSQRNNWGRLYFQVQGTGLTTIFLVWVQV